LAPNSCGYSVTTTLEDQMLGDIRDLAGSDRAVGGAAPVGKA
jgi:hypothetical protein